MKICNKCNINKDLIDFYKDKTHKDGLTSNCKLCKNKMNQSWRIDNREKDLKDKHNYYIKNKEHFYLLSRKWISKNPELNHKYKRKYKFNNRVLLNEWDKKRYKKEQDATPYWTNKELLKQIFINAPIGYVVDHIIPLNHKKMSGLNIPENLRYLTEEENNRKNNKLDSEINFQPNPITWQSIIYDKKAS